MISLPFSRSTRWTTAFFALLVLVVSSLSGVNAFVVPNSHDHNNKATAATYYDKVGPVQAHIRWKILPTTALQLNNIDDDNKIDEETTSSNDEPPTGESIAPPKSTTLSPSESSSIKAVASKRDSKSNSLPNLTKTSTGSSNTVRTASTSSSSSSSSSQTTTTATKRWDSFDYHQHWYPVIWEIDLPINKPTQVTLFDVDYVVARDGKGGWTALLDRCPHKAAALSEGRITSSGFIQCAYHGWSFDGTNGDCVQIPQSAKAASNSNSGGGGSFPARACAKAIPLRVHQGMVWLWPGPIQETYPTPPTVPEMDLPGWTSIKIVRDFPCVDWSLLVSNILDPDHGCFAHTQLAFDFYSASAEHPMEVQETFEDAGWTLESQVSAEDKLLKVNKANRESLGLKTKKEKPNGKDGKPVEPLSATTIFHAPTTVALGRRDANGDTKFITAFWVTPVGTGRSRFMSASVSNSFPFKVPRWILTISLNRFLDQDTVLVASQQPPLLTAEAQGVERPRASLFSYGSATDKTVRLIDQFWDATLSRAPNRHIALQHLYRSGQLQRTPPREEVLDRKTQHLDICPDSQGFVRKCRTIRNTSLGVLAAWMVRAVWQRALLPTSKSKFLLQLWLPLLTAGVAWSTDQLQKQFFFVKTKSSRDKDLEQIPIKAWLDI